jgi:hypothetical protein
VVVELAVKGHSAYETGTNSMICHENVDLEGKPMHLTEIFAQAGYRKQRT